MTSKQEFLQAILSQAHYPGMSADKEWAQYPTTNERAIALLQARIETGKKYRMDNSFEIWAIAQLKKQ